MIDKDKMFSLFEQPDGKKDGKELITMNASLLDEPFTKIGMFTKLILNHFVFQEKLKKFLKTEEPAYDIENTEVAANYTVFNKAWGYIKEIDIDNESHFTALIGFNPTVFNKALQSAISYFQEHEEYERCAHLFKIQQIVKEI